MVVCCGKWYNVKALGVIASWYVYNSIGKQTLLSILHSAIVGYIVKMSWMCCTVIQWYILTK